MAGEDVVAYLSGGASNTDPDASLGGVISSTAISHQTATRQTTNISGLTVNHGRGNLEGVGSVVYDYSATPTKEMVWFEPGNGGGTPVDVSSDGTYYLPSFGNAAVLSVTVVAASLPTQDYTDQVSIKNPIENLFDNIPPGEAEAGSTNYRCLYLKNTDGTQTYSVDVWFRSTSGSIGQDSVFMAFDAAGAGGTATTIANELTEPSGSLTWVQPTEATALSVSLTAGQSIGLWLKRVVPTYVTEQQLSNASHIRLKVYV